MKPAVIIVGPPWLRSGTGRVLENQVQFYRSRGYQVFFIGVAIQGNYVWEDSIWDAFSQGAHELGADYVAIAAFDRSTRVLTKLSSTVRYGLRGTRLDWIADIARSARLSDDVVRLLRQLPVALLHVNHMFTVDFALRLRDQLTKKDRSVPIILETHDVQSHLLNEMGNCNPWTGRPDRLGALLRSETRRLESANVLVHLSLDDFEFFRARMPHKPHLLTLPTIDEAFVSEVNAASLTAEEAIDLLFVGQHNLPNLGAVEWFLQEVWPLLADRNYNLKIVGAVEGMVRAMRPQLYAAFRPYFVGPVGDLVPYYRAAKCVIAPMVSGSGISIKTIEAFALGKPFVGTSKAFRGMPMERIGKVGLRAHDDPQDFADAIVRTLSCEESAGRLSRAAYDSVFSSQAASTSRDDAVSVAFNGKDSKPIAQDVVRTQIARDGES